MSESVLGLVPARGGSKGVPRKNIKKLLGKPLIAYSITAGIESTIIDNVVVSTDDQEIKEIAQEYGANVPFTRPDKLATDKAAMEPVIEHAIEFEKERGKDYETLLLLQPTSPLRTATNIDAAMEKYHRENADSLVSVLEDHSYRWVRTDNGASRINYQGERKRRQNKAPEYVENGAIYAVDVDNFLETRDLQTGKTALYVMDSHHSVDIDDSFDLWIAEQSLKKSRDSTGSIA